MRALLAGVAAAGLVAAGATTAAAGTVSRPYTVTVQRGHVKTTYRCVRSPVRSTWRRADCIPVLRPRVTLDAARVALNGFTGGTAIYQDNANWWWRVTQQTGLLEIDNVYTPQGYRFITHPADGWVEIQLGNHGGNYQGDCVTWNQSIQAFDAIGCQFLVSQEWTFGGESDPSEGTEWFDNRYTGSCAQANDSAGEGAEIGTRSCANQYVTFWQWEALVD